MNEEYFRVTSCQYIGSKYAIFTGVPLKPDSYLKNSGKYVVSIKCEFQTLPVEPSIGQYWRVCGQRELKTIPSGEYELEQHLYESPDEMECTLPETGEALIRFIASEKDFTGIGESKARSLWNAFGKDIHSMLQSDTSENRLQLRSILSDSSVEALYKGYAKYKNLPHANWLASLGVPMRIQQRIIKYHDVATIKVIKTNPYALLGFGMPFADIDSIAEQMEIDKSSPVRLAAAVEGALRKQVKKGHTYSSHQSLKPEVVKILGGDKELAAEALSQGYRNGQFILREETGTYHPTAQIMMESVVAKRLTALSKIKTENDAVFKAMVEAVSELPYNLTKQQVKAVESSLTNAVSCITGGAGTGKTIVLRTVLRAYELLGYEIHAVALSGRAAMRLHESIGFVTSTVARLLIKDPVVPCLAKPNHLLVIYEASMIDLPTMYQIITHIDPSVSIVFTGDPDLLPPIGCGKVLSDIIESGLIAAVRLNIVKRQESSTGIPEYSATINQGALPESLSVGSITFHETPSGQVVRKCKELYAESPHNTQILGATKALAHTINRDCQQFINADGDRLRFTIDGDKHFLDIREGDPIQFTKNNYNVDIQNGSLGWLTSAEFTPEEKKAEALYGIVTLDTGEEIKITEDLLDSIELGYAITLHKAQGSQYPRVIVPVEKGTITDRVWIYTAMTRAESEVHLVGKADEFAEIVKKVSNANRKLSFLRELLQEATV